MSYRDLTSSLKNKFLSKYLTSKMDFRLENGCLTIKICKDGLKSNMQNNVAAFESWAIALKYHLSEEIEKVIIDWDMPVAFTSKERLHYNRFLYRLRRFTETYSWISSAKLIEALPTCLVCNFPNGEASPQSAYSKGREGWLECQYVEEKKSNFEMMARQLPVGLFQGKIFEDTRFTTDGALDIWALQKDELFIYELKTASNCPLGILSELIFYTNVVNDLLCHKINYLPSKMLEKSKDFRGFRKFYELYEKRSIQQINAVFLSKNLHPLITDGLIEFINESEKLTKSRIHFSYEPLKF